MQIDLLLQGKGGVGKSYVAALLAQFHRSRGLAPICVDTDPVNATFAGYQALGVERLELMQGRKIDSRQFDVLIERIFGVEDPAAVMVVDNGASTFVPLCEYLADNEIIAYLAEHGHTVRLHTVLTGGQALDDTFNGLTSLAASFAKAPIVVWLNEFFGPLERNGVNLRKSKEYAALAKRIYAEITLPELQKETFGRDLEEVLSARLTFEEAAKFSGFSIMARQRLKMVWRKAADQMEQVQL